MEEDNETPSSSTLKSASKERKYVQKFKTSWLEHPDFKTWLKKSDKGETKAYCKICDCDLVCGMSELLKHKNSAKHTKKMAVISQCGRMSTFLNKNQTHATNVLKMELKMCGFLAKHDLPISLVDDLVSLLRNLFPESKCLDDVHLGKQKATNILRQVTGATYKQEVIDIMKNSYFNIIIDETTDLSVKKQLAIIITFFNSLTKKVEYRFFDLIDMIDGTAKGILQTIKGSFSKHEVPLDHVFGLTSDTTNVMMGKHNSVQALLKTEIPHLVVIECSCHLIHLATSYASRKLPKNLEDLCRNIPAYFHMSPKRTEALKQFQDFLKIDQHKLLSAANTRWLSLQACVDRILEQYDALKLFFTGAVFEDPSNTNDSILNSLNNPFNKALLHFMSYVFSITNDFNTFFQTKSPQ